MNNCGCRLGFTGKPLFGEGTLCEMRCEHFDGDAAFEVTIEPLKNDSHSATADDFQHVIAAKLSQRIRIVGGLKMLDREVDFRELFANGKFRIEFIGKEHEHALKL